MSFPITRPDRRGRVGMDSEILIAGKALRQMAARRAPGCTLIAVPDRVANCQMFALDTPEITFALALRHCAEAQALARNYKAAEHVENAREIGVLRRNQNGPVKGEIFLGARLNW